MGDVIPIVPKNAIVSHVFFGSTYWLAESPTEWVQEKGRAVRMTEADARRFVFVHGGTVVLLDQHRAVAGELGRESERGPRG